ncbi:hypothetical protein VTO42DRAFT_1 [Malbranchea cinnamomea]
MSDWQYLYDQAIPLSSAYTAPAYPFYSSYSYPDPTQDSPLFDYRVERKRVPWEYSIPMDIYEDDEAPDVIIIKNRGRSFTLEFPAYTIGDGVLSVGDVREAAAARLGVSPARRVKLLYKGRLLKVDDIPAKLVGLKQNSRVLCVVGEDFGPEGSSSELSVDDEVASSAAEGSRPVRRPQRRRSKRLGATYDIHSDDHELFTEPPRHRRHRSPSLPREPRQLAGHSPPDLSSFLDRRPLGSSLHLHPPFHERRPSSRPPARSPSRGPPAERRAPTKVPPSSNPNTAGTPLARVEMLEEYFDTVIEPLCLGYIENPPHDPKTRDFEHKRIGEIAMQQLILKADGINLEGDDYARQRRKALLGKVEKLLKVVDDVANQ